MAGARTVVTLPRLELDFLHKELNMKLKLKVIPNASSNSIVGWLGESLKVKVSSVAEKGNANKAVITLLSKSLNIDKRRISIIKGTTSALKIVNLKDVSKTQIMTDLGKPEAHFS